MTQNLSGGVSPDEWVWRGETTSKTAKVDLSAKKVMITVLCDVHGINYLQKGTIIHDENYVNSLNPFNGNLKKKRPQSAKTKALFPQHNTKVHRCLVAMAPTSTILSGFSSHIIWEELKNWTNSGRSVWNSKETYTRSN